MVVAGAVRDKRPGRGDELVDVPGMLVTAFRRAGLHQYNDAVYVRLFGSASRWLRRTYELGGAKLQSVRACCAGSAQKLCNRRSRIAVHGAPDA